MGKDGWAFADSDPFPGASVDDVNHAKYLKDLYLLADPDYTGRFVPFSIIFDAGSVTFLHQDSLSLFYGTRKRLLSSITKVPKLSAS